jgi:hypothetical protein
MEIFVPFYHQLFLSSNIDRTIAPVDKGLGRPEIISESGGDEKDLNSRAENRTHSVQSVENHIMYI